MQKENFILILILILLISIHLLKITVVGSIDFDGCPLVTSLVSCLVIQYLYIYIYVYVYVYMSTIHTTSLLQHSSEPKIPQFSQRPGYLGCTRVSHKGQCELVETCPQCPKCSLSTNRQWFKCQTFGDLAAGQRNTTVGGW